MKKCTILCVETVRSRLLSSSSGRDQRDQFVTWSKSRARDFTDRPLSSAKK